VRGIHYELPADPDALHRMYTRPQLRYAATVLADMKAAETDRRAPPLPHLRPTAALSSKSRLVETRNHRAWYAAATPIRHLPRISCG
jgi:hypothetical protein